MKKRILAMLLVLCLVASVMPMTVLAAPADCPDEHTLNNCKATFVQSVAASTCQVRSYDLYRCDACGELFAENFGAYGPHKWIGESDYICGAFDGDSVVYCEYCYTEKDHVYDCAGKCVCGEKSDDPADFGHDWDNKNAVIVKAPVNCTEAGLAEITCKACGLKKTAAVYGVHAWGAPVEPKDPTCTVDGNLCYRKCANCDAYQIGTPVLDGNDDFTYDVSGNLIADFDEKIVALKDVILPAAHSLPTTIINAVVTSSVRLYTADAAETVIIEINKASSAMRIRQRNAAGVVATYDIPAGLSTVIVLSLADGDYINVSNTGNGESASFKLTAIDNADLKLFVPSTCYIAGRYQVECTVCKELTTVALGTAAHDWHLQASKAESCTTYGYEVYACIDCGAIESVSKPPINCYDTYEEIKAYFEKQQADGKISKEELKAALDRMYTAPTCVKTGKYQWACPICTETKSEIIPALGCDLKTETIPATIHHAGATYTYCARGAACDCVCTCNLMVTQGLCLCGHKNDIDKLFAIDSVLYQMVASKGQKVHKVLSTTAKLADNALNADAHDWVLTGSTATCKSAGEDGYVCVYCYKTKTVPADKKPHEAYNKDVHGDLKVKPATCKANGKKYYTCSKCGTDVTVETLYYNPYVILTDVEAQAIHKNLGAITWLNSHVDPCTTPVYGQAYCSDCKATIVVFKAGTGAHVMPNGFKLPAPTCETQTGTYHCSQCNQDIAWEVKGEHKLPNPAVKGDCYTEGTNAWGECSVCHKYIEQVKDPAGHDMVATHDYVASCTKWGGNLYVCSVCGLSEIYNYIPEAHDYVLNVDKSDAYAGCMASGTQYWECSKCDAEYSLHLEGLGYHVNTFGYKIDYSACPDCNKAANNLGDEFFWHPMNGSYDCIYCGAYLENLGREATCTQDGYAVYGWTCGHNGYLGYLPKLDHDYQPANYGIYTCFECINGCGAQKNLESTGDVILSISDDIGEKEIITDGSLVTFTVDMSAYKTDLFGYSFKMWYLANALEFVDYEVLTENFKYNALVHNNVSLNEDLSFRDDDGKLVYGFYDGIVSVVGQSKTDGKNFQLTGTEDLVAITFKVINAEQFFKWILGEEMPPFAAYAAYRPQLNAALPFPIEIGDIEIVKNVIENGKVVDVEYVYAVEYDLDIEEWYYVDYLDYAIPVNRLMDADFDGEVSYRDAAIVWQMASGAIEYKYAEHLDLNGNGEIDHVDAKLIYQYFVGILTYDEVLNYNA